MKVPTVKQFDRKLRTATVIGMAILLTGVLAGRDSIRTISRDLFATIHKLKFDTQKSWDEGKTVKATRNWERADKLVK
jgi:hypothetical protein